MKPYILVFLCVSFWAGNFVIGRYLKDDFTPLELSFLRWSLVLLILSPYILYRFKTITTHIKEYFLQLLGLSVLSVTIFNTLLYFGLSYTTSNNALIINLSVPILVLILSALILKIKIEFLHILGIFFSIIGVLVIISKMSLTALIELSFNYGDIIVIVTSLVWALYSVIVKLRPKEILDFDYFSIIVLLGTPFILLLYIIAGAPSNLELKTITTHIYPLLYISFLSSIASYIFWHYGIDTIGANKTSQFTYLMPVIGALIAYIFLDEKLELFHLVGMIFIGIGIYISLFLTKKEN
jgi:drug/metabolite transporter (DMT)-like permease